MVLRVFVRVHVHVCACVRVCLRVDRVSLGRHQSAPGPGTPLVSYTDCRRKSALFIDKQSQVCERETMLFETPGKVRTSRV